MFHLKSKPNVNQKIDLLLCNSTAIPTATNYDWYLNEQQITTPSRNTGSLQLFNLNRDALIDTVSPKLISKFMSSLISIKTILNETEKRYCSQLNLHNLTFSYYSC